MKDHAALLIRDSNNKFIFVRRSKNKKTLPNIWAFPSGTKELGETIYETAVREAYEELDINIKAEQILTTKELPELGSKLHFIICTIISGNPVIKDHNEIEEIEWLTFSEFFNKYDDTKIGHGLIFLRQNPQIWKEFS